MRLLICAGGTGGGVYPALAVVQALVDDGKTTDDGQKTTDVPSSIVHRPSSILWIGSLGGVEADLVKRAGLAYTGIPAAGVHGVGWRALPGNLAKLLQGVLAARRTLWQFRPDVMLFTGGYLAVPVALAGNLPRLGLPRPRSLLYVPDIEPGLALKTLARFADCIAVSTEDSLRYFPPAYRRKIRVTGYPLRQELMAWDREAARQFLDLSLDLPVLLVMGGSTGARSINRALLENLPALLAEVQVIHLSGRRDWSEVEAARRRLPREKTSRYRAYPYLHSEQLGAALTLADLAVTRAGASILGELPQFALPAILVPYPHAWRYQQVNAEYLARRGAATILKDADLPAELIPTVRRLAGDPQALETMRAALRNLAQPQAAASLAELAWRLAGQEIPAGGGEL